MTVRLTRDYTTYNYVKKEDEALPQGTQFEVLGDFHSNGANGVNNTNGEYVIPGAYLETIAEENDGI